MAIKPQDGSAEPLSEQQKARIRATLDRVLSSQAFRKSEQCQRFLRHVVEMSLDAREDLLRERTMGIEVFGRQPDYDTAEDPVVRVRATEVRKRLAQYSGESAAEEDVRFEIPSGSYRVEFHWAAPARASSPVAALPPPKAKPRFRWALWALAAAVLAGIAGMLLLRHEPAPPTVVDRFWAPAFESDQPMLIYCGQPVAYFLSQRVRDQYRQTLPSEKPTRRLPRYAGA